MWVATVLVALPLTALAYLERPPLSTDGEGCGFECGSWYVEAARSAQRYFTECRRRTGVFNSLDEDLVVSVVRLKNCFKEHFLKSLDEAIDEKELPLTPYVTLINEDNSNLRSADARQDAVTSDLIASISKRFSRILDTHSFKFNFSRFLSNSSDIDKFEEVEDDDSNEEGARSWERESRQGLRGRRRRHQYRKAFPMMVAGYMMMSAFLVPLGFQFMAMLGGKALLLAKMAFFMSLFSGYKRLTNDLEYHHHAVPPVAHVPHHDFIPGHYGGFHHRSSQEEPITTAMLNQLTNLPTTLYRQMGLNRRG